jgi:hypothetical protein
MDATRFDRISAALSRRRLSRRRAMAEGGTALAAAGVTAAGLARPIAAQSLSRAQGGDATPTAEPGADAPAPAMLFVQSFQSGTIAPKEGEDGRYTLTLEQGLGQTIYFSDRPERIVGTDPTPQFLEGMPFLPDNPPNAALVVETGAGETAIAVVELFSPLYDPVTRGVIYEVATLADWENSTELGLREAPADLAALAASFGSAHLFIDDCPNMDVNCVLDYPSEEPDPPPEYPHAYAGTYSSQPMCWNYGLCIPCEPYGHTQPDRCSTLIYWRNKCGQQFPRCQTGEGPCEIDWNWPGHRWLCWDHNA